MSYRFDRIRRSRLMDLTTTSRDVSSISPTPAAIFDSPVVTQPRSQIPRPSNASTENRRESFEGPSEGDNSLVRPFAKAARSLSSDDARPSGLPRLASNASRSRRPSESSVTSSRPSPSPRPPITPSPVTPNVNKFGLPGERPRNVLRRKGNFRRQNVQDVSAKPSSQNVDDPKPSSSAISSSAPATYGIGIMSGSSHDLLHSGHSSSTMTSRLPRTKTPRAAEELPTRQIPKEFAGLQTVVNTTNLPPPPTPIFPSTSSPSTRYSESPGMWSSRDSTPTSLSSYSPGIVQPAKGIYRLRQASPTQTRQPIISRSLTAPNLQFEHDDRTILGPIASCGTVAPYAGVERPRHTPVDKNPPPPRSPPPRKSSMKFKSPKKTTKDDEQFQSAQGHRAIDDAEERIFSPVSQPEAVPPTQNSPEAPSRPTRQGTEKLDLVTSPVIKSNLTTLRTSGHTRRESAEKIVPPENLRVMPAGSAATSVESLQSSHSSRRPSRPETPSQLPKKIPRTLTKSPKELKEPTSANSGKRFGLFTKKSRTDLTAENSDSVDKPTRKGPAAGTGHEGYGKYAYRGRKSSVGSSSGARARSTSTTARSVTSSKGSASSRPELDIDDFLLDRLDPVIISGGGMSREQIVRTQSEHSISSLSATSAWTSSVLNKAPATSTYSSDSLVSSIEPVKPVTRLLSSETHLPSQIGSLYKVDSSLSSNNSSLSLQIPQEGRSRKRRGSDDTRTTHEGSAEPKFSALPPISNAGSKPGLSDTTKKPDKRKGIKWNFFHRSRTVDQKAQSPVSDAQASASLQATIAPVNTNRPVAHYALLDADSDSLDEILHRIEESDSPPSEAETALPVGSNPNPDLQTRHGTSILLPSRPAMWSESTESKENRPASPKVFFHNDVKEDSLQTDQARPSRLAPVGRIPRVVSRRDRDHKPPSQSFSRPFSRDEAPSLTITAGSQPEVYYTSSRPLLDVQTDVLPSRPFHSEPDTAKPLSAPVVSESMKFASGAYASNEFLQFSPRKQSQVSSSTSEGDSILAAVTAIGIPPTEEDIWTEYDDFLDSVLPQQSTVGRTSPKPPNIGEQFEMATKASKTLQAELNAANVKPQIVVSETNPAPDMSPTSARSSGGSVRLRRSKIAAALYSSASLSPQVSYSELISGYEERNKSSNELTYLESPSEPSHIDDQLASSPINNTPDFESTRRRNTMLFDIAERNREGTVAQTNLRSASLMTSRWLSFGRVLFSPAHSRVKTSDSERILVIDGLGNDDWSYYCALTYPNATVYSLSIRPTASSSPHPDAWKPPENYHLIHHASANALFPFPKGFFAVCILRFPAACSEYGQRNMISECKRVLRPGGYLEMSILDLDLVNVGTRTRKAVRMLKERIYQADPNISLKPASDNIQRLLGICGFDNLNRCMVSAPVAGVIMGSSDSSNSNKSGSLPVSTASTGPSLQSAFTTGSHAHQKTPSDDAQVSLGELLSDPSPSASNDESIAKMVARVGRWWYTRCYEIPVLSDGALDRSIWVDPRLLRECQKRGTGFRLLIAYAQKPSEKRRTVSV